MKYFYFIFFFFLYSSPLLYAQYEDMVLINGGEYTIGITEDDFPALLEIGKDVPHMSPGHAKWWFSDEQPQHNVKIHPFYIDKYEVTNSEFALFVEKTNYQPEGNWKKYFTEGRANHPVVAVTYQDALAYAEWVGKRLPTEIEWEIAAKGGSNFKWFTWGNKPDPTKAQWRHQGESFFDGLSRLVFGRSINTRPVGSFDPNGYGLFDMVGNVDEWTSSDYAPYPGYSSLFTDDDPPTDFTDKLFYKVIRGGNWDSPNPVFIRITDRKGVQKETESYTIGFRCVQSIEPNN